MRQQNQSSGVLAADDAIIWIIKNQFGRRNLSVYDRSILALKLKPVIAAQAKENMLATQNNNAASACQKSSPEIKAESLSVRTKYLVGKNLFGNVVVAFPCVRINQRR